MLAKGSVKSPASLPEIESQSVDNGELRSCLKIQGVLSFSDDSKTLNRTWNQNYDRHEDSFEPHSSDALPNSTRVYIAGRIHPTFACPSAKSSSARPSFDGQIEVNEPVRVLRLQWAGVTPISAATSSTVCRRCDTNGSCAAVIVEEYEGREAKPSTMAICRRPMPSMRATQGTQSPDGIPRRQAQTAPGFPRPPGHATLSTPARESSRRRWVIAIRENMQIADCQLAIGDLSMTTSATTLANNTRQFQIDAIGNRQSTPIPTPHPSSAVSPSGSRRRSPRSPSAMKSPVAAPSSRPTSTTRKASR